MKELPKEIPLEEETIKESSTISLEQYQKEIEFADGEYLAYGCKRKRPHLFDD